MWTTQRQATLKVAFETEKREATGKNWFLSFAIH